MLGHLYRLLRRVEIQDEVLELVLALSERDLALRERFLQSIVAHTSEEHVLTGADQALVDLVIARDLRVRRVPAV